MTSERESTSKGIQKKGERNKNVNEEDFTVIEWFYLLSVSKGKH